MTLKYASSRSSRIKVHKASWKHNRTVQGHPMSVVMGSPLMVFYLTSIVSNIVFFTVFVIFHAEVL